MQHTDVAILLNFYLLLQQLSCQHESQRPIHRARQDQCVKRKSAHEDVHYFLKHPHVPFAQLMTHRI